MFEDPDFIEIYRKIKVLFHVVRSEPDPNFPTRPKLYITGEIQGDTRMFGWVNMTPDGNVRWHFVSKHSQYLCIHFIVRIDGRNLARRVMQYGGMPPSSAFNRTDTAL